MYNPRKLKQLSFILLGLSFSYAILAYALSSFLQQIVPTAWIGAVYTLSYCLAFWLSYRIAHYVRRFGRYHTAALLFILNVAPLVYLAYSPAGFSALIALVAYLVSQIALLVMVDVYIAANSDEQMTGAIRGAQLTYMNFGIMLGPLTAGWLLTSSSYHKLFLLAATIGFITTLFFLDHFTDDAEHILKVHEPRWWQTLKQLVTHRHLSPLLLASFLLNFFYSWMVIYTPLYLRSLNMSWSEIGRLLFIILIPFVLIQYAVGWLLDRRLHEKTTLMISFLLLAIPTALLTNVPATFWWITVLLFITRLGAAALEVVSDAAFFRRVTASEVDLIDFYRLSRPLAYILGPAIGSVLLVYLPLTSLFPILGIIMLSGLYFSAHLKPV